MGMVGGQQLVSLDCPKHTNFTPLQIEIILVRENLFSFVLRDLLWFSYKSLSKFYSAQFYQRFEKIQCKKIFITKNDSSRIFSHYTRSHTSLFIIEDHIYKNQEFCRLQYQVRYRKFYNNTFPEL